MLGSNQRPLPCEGRSITSWLFAGVQNHLQNRRFYRWVYSSLFAVVRVGWCTNWCSPGCTIYETISTTPRITANFLSWPWPTLVFFRYASSVASRHEEKGPRLKASALAYC